MSVYVMSPPLPLTNIEGADSSLKMCKSWLCQRVSVWFPD